MYVSPLTLDVSTLSGNLDPLSVLHEALADLLLILHQQRNSTLRDLSRNELPSLYLRKLQYVYGEKSAAKCSMRFLLTISPVAEPGHAAEETLTLELNVREALKCSAQSSAR